MSTAAAITTAIETAGNMSRLAKLLGVKPQQVWKWKDKEHVPAKRVLQIERATGVSRHVLRPDLYPIERR